MPKIISVSDLHGFLPEIPKCDILIIAGDICPTHDHHVDYQASWLNTNFKHWLTEVPAKHIIGIFGNHDFIGEKAPHKVPKLPWIYLEDSGVNLFGLNIYGSPWQPVFYDWSFNLTEEELAKKWALIPVDTEVLITHGPPLGYGDLTDRGEHVGSYTLMNRLHDLTKLKLHCYGHIHSGRGQYQFNSAILANVTLLDERYRMVYKPMVFEI
jgi:Icc-related predicted phosphoesterase